MLIETPQTLLYVTGGAFLLGWIIGKIGAFFGSRHKTKKRDPRDDRIRSLEAEFRVARSDADKSSESLETRDKELTAATETTKLRDATVAEQLEIIEQLRADLKESVMKTRELRGELTDRATENVKSEVKLREVETELSVAKASTDLIATGVLDYTTTYPNVDSDAAVGKGPRIVKAATGE